MFSNEESENPIESMTKGVTKGFLEWSSEKIAEFIGKLKDKKLAFIQEEETIRIVKEQYNSGELSFYKGYIEDKELLFIIKLGLTLRRLQKSLERKQNLRENIFSKYEVKGLHIAQFVENGLLNRYIGILIDDLISIEDFKNKILNVLNNIEKHVIFVKSTDVDRMVIQSVSSVVASHSPMIFVVSGMASAAGIVRSCESRFVELLMDYELEKMSSGDRENLFFKRKIK